jgi:hypothetical protein
LRPLSEAGVDVFHCSQRRFWEPEFEGSDLNFAGWTKKLTGKPTITVGSVGLDGEFIAAFGGAGSKPASLDSLIERLERDEFDLVAVGRALLADPHWVEKIRDGRTDELQNFERQAWGFCTRNPPPTGEGDREAVEGADANAVCGSAPSVTPLKKRRATSPIGGGSRRLTPCSSPS